MIELSDVSKHYAMGSSDVMVLQQLDMTVDPQERVAIIGPSGSGKTTLLLILTGLETPSQGKISIAKQSLEHMSL